MRLLSITFLRLPESSLDAIQLSHSRSVQTVPPAGAYTDHPATLAAYQNEPIRPFVSCVQLPVISKLKAASPTSKGAKSVLGSAAGAEARAVSNGNGCTCLEGTRLECTQQQPGQAQELMYRRQSEQHQAHDSCSWLATWPRDVNSTRLERVLRCTRAKGTQHGSTTGAKWRERASGGIGGRGRDEGDIALVEYVWLMTIMSRSKMLQSCQNLTGKAKPR